jgi:hypothetical protein
LNIRKLELDVKKEMVAMSDESAFRPAPRRVQGGPDPHRIQGAFE